MFKIVQLWAHSIRVDMQIVHWLCLIPSGDELHINLDTITTEDVEAALLHTKPSARGMTGKYMAWQQEYESS